VIWCDELHWKSGLKYVKNIKRLPGTRFREDNIQRNKNARCTEEMGKIERFYLFTVVGRNFCWATPYDAGNSNGKMNARTYISQILPKLHEAIIGRELVLWQDLDSAHASKAVIEWMWKHGMDHIEAPLTSPDLLVMETWVKLIRGRFYKSNCLTAEEGRRRFY
jgi:hypothetical protein